MFNSLHAGYLLLHAFWFLLIFFFFFKFTFSKKSFRNPSECHTVWIQIRPDVFVRPDLGPNCLQRLSVDDKSSLAEKELKHSRIITVIFYLIFIFHYFSVKI